MADHLPVVDEMDQREFRFIDMNKFFLPTSRKVLPTFQTFCPVGVHFAQMVVDFAHFQVQARKRGVLDRVFRFVASDPVKCILIDARADIQQASR